MRTIRRLVVGVFFMVAIATLGLVIDTAGAELLQINRDWGVDEGPFAPVIMIADNVMWLIVPLLLLGVLLWMIWGVVQQERREDEFRRIP